jgi:branched-chain amino acid transport system ATP-binding protein
VLLQLEDVHAHYGKSHVLQGVSLAVDAGEVVSLLGRNGVGKSTTMKTIVGMHRTTTGIVRWRGAPVERLRCHEIARRGVGYVPEERRIFPTITVWENLIIGRKAPIDPALEPWTPERLFRFFPRLAERRSQRAGALSGGEQEMLSIGRTLMGNPQLLLLDEPTEGLAPQLVEEVEALIREVSALGLAILLVEQSIAVARSLATRAYVMAKGAVVFEGGMAALTPDHPVVTRYLQV